MLATQVARHLDILAPAGARCLVAVSGGPDSLALLDLLWQGRAVHQRELVIGHIEHGINPDAKAGLKAIESWLVRVSSAASTTQRSDVVAIPRLYVATLSLGGAASETVAREARRKALRALAHEASAACIVLAHHAADQAETILLRLLRGSGPAGLAGMSARRGIWLRPLLHYSPAQLRQHLSIADLDFWDDPANLDPVHLRSWLRQRVIPLLQERLPDLPERLLTAGRHAATARKAWDEVTKVLPDLSVKQEKHGISVAATALNGYSSGLRSVLLGTIGRWFGVPIGDRRVRAVEQLLAAGQGRADLSGRLQVELAFGRLIFRRCGAVALSQPVPLHDGVVWGGYRFSLRPGRVGAVTRSSWSTWLPAGEYQVRGWQPGDRVRPLGAEGHRAVAVLLKEARVAPGARPGWPVVTGKDGATILWVPGICRSGNDVPQEETLAIHVDCAAC